MTARTLGHFRLLEEIGRGGMGVVYRALDERLSREVAVKVLHSDASTGSARDRQRLIREARTAARIEHPNVATIHELDEVDGETYVAMELVRGETLRQRLDRGPIPLDEFRHLAGQISAGLDAAHRLGIVHRDLKPENIALTPDGTVKLLDFGLARLRANLDTTRVDAEATRSMNVTIEGRIAGTIPYMSPEQITGSPVDARSDIFSFGVILYELLSGQRPFRGETFDRLRHEILHAQPDSLMAQRKEVGRTFDNALRKCLAKNPEERFSTSVELLEALEPSAGRSGRAWWVGGVAAVALVAAISLATRVRHAPEPLTAGESDMLTVAVAPFANFGSEAGDAGELVRQLVEQELRTLSETAPLKLLEGVLDEPVQSDEQARAAGGAVHADVVCWGNVLTVGKETEIEARLSLVRPVERIAGAGGETALQPAAASFQEMVRMLPMDRAGQLEAWRGSAKDVADLVATLSGLALIRAAEYERAAELLGGVSDPSADQLFYLGLAELRRGRTRKAAEAFRGAVALDDQHVGSRLGLLTVGPGDNGLASDERFAILRDALEQDPLHLRANFELAEMSIFLDAGNHYPALFEHLERLCATTEGPVEQVWRLWSNLPLLSQRGQTERLNKVLSACRSFPSLDHFDPGFATTACYADRATELEWPGCDEWALEPYAVHPFVFLGYLAAKLGLEGDTTALAAELETVARHDPGLADRAGMWALVIGIGAKDGDAASSWLDRVASEVDREYPFARGVIEFSRIRKNWTGARAWFDQASESDGGRDSVLRFRAVTDLAEGRFEAALEILEHRENPERPAALAGSGRLCDGIRARILLDGSPDRINVEVMDALCRRIEREPAFEQALLVAVREKIGSVLAKAGIEASFGGNLTIEGGLPVYRPEFTLVPRYDAVLPSDVFGLVELVESLPGRSPEIPGVDQTSTVELLRDLSRIATNLSRTTEKQGAESIGDWDLRVAVGDVEQAEQLLRERVDQHPSGAEAWAQLGYLYYEAQRTAEALEALRRSALLRPTAEMYYRVGSLEGEIKLFDQAEASHLRALELDPDHAWAHYGIGRDRLKQGLPAEAVPYFQRAAQLEPGEPWFWEGLGAALTEIGNVADAEPALLRAIELRPGKAKTHRNLAICYRTQRRYADAVPVLQKLIALNPDEVWGHMELGKNLRLLGRLDEAETELRTALKVDPDDAWTHSQLGWLERNRNRIEESIPHFERASELNTDTPGIWGDLGTALHEAGDSAKAEAAFRKLIELRRRMATRDSASAADKNTLAWLLLTCAAEALRDPEIALRFALEANELGGNSRPYHLDTLALAYHRTGQGAEAVRVQREALELLPAGAVEREDFATRLAEFSADLDASR